MNPNPGSDKLAQQWRQALSLCAFVALILLILLIWSSTSVDLLLSGSAGALIALGRLAGLTAAGAALLQFMLMGRIGWIEGGFGLDKIAKVHRKNGMVVLAAIYIHIALVTSGYALGSMVDLVSQYVTFFNTFQDVWKATLAAILFTAVGGTSFYIVRRKLKFERWYIVHLLVYAAIILAFSHQLSVGGSFTANPVYSNIWTGLYLFVAANVLYYRFLKLGINYLRFGFRIERVEKEAGDITSVYISGKNLTKFKPRAGQFIMIRILDPKYWLQEHPFSLSQVTTDTHMRITVKNSGDYTATIQSLKPGARVMVAGPYGAFTRAKATTKKRLYLAGGIGITPLRSMIEEGTKLGDDAVLIWANRFVVNEVFGDELKQFEKQGLKILHFLSDEQRAGHETGRQHAGAVPGE